MGEERSSVDGAGWVRWGSFPRTVRTRRVERRKGGVWFRGGVRTESGGPLGSRGRERFRGSRHCRPGFVSFGVPDSEVRSRWRRGKRKTRFTDRSRLLWVEGREGGDRRDRRSRGSTEPGVGRTEGRSVGEWRGADEEVAGTDREVTSGGRGLGS